MANGLCLRINECVYATAQADRVASRISIRRGIVIPEVVVTLPALPISELPRESVIKPHRPGFDLRLCAGDVLWVFVRGGGAEAGAEWVAFVSPCGFVDRVRASGCSSDGLASRHRSRRSQMIGMQVEHVNVHRVGGCVRSRVVRSGGTCAGDAQRGLA